MPDDHSRSDDPSREARLYLPLHEGWSVGIKRDWSKEYCFLKNLGEDYYHLLMSGEIYVEHGSDKYCLNCALRHGYLTRNRTFWQRDRGPTIQETNEGI
jgi:hypothetical protein